MEGQTNFWNRILGETLNKKLGEEEGAYILPADLEAASEYSSFHAFFETWKAEENGQTHSLKTEIFGGIYSLLISAYLQWLQPDLNKFRMIENSGGTLVWTLYERVREIPFRVCCFEMQSLKQKRLLQGRDEREEYEFFCGHYLEDPLYIKELCNQYPEMLRLFFVRFQFTYQYLETFVRHLEKDRKWIETHVCRGEVLRCVRDLRMGGSDSHCGGKTVITCRTDQGRGLIYKPHSLKKEELYQGLYGSFCKELGMESFKLSLYDGGSYGWEECLEAAPCEQEEQAGRFYKRIGIHLFLCMLLSGSDMHQENVLAVGEHPVLLDLETFPGYRRKHLVKNAEDRIEEILQGSVLRPGILPVPILKAEDRAVCLSAVYQEEERFSPVRLPVILDEKTSNMRMDHRYIKMKPGKSMPVYQGKRVLPDQYMDNICEGFSESYEVWRKHSDLWERRLAAFWECPVRFLVRHTQQYTMYRFTSLHPAFLSSTKARVKLLQVLQKGETDKRFVAQEINALFQLDVPLLECDGKEARECYLDRKSQCKEADLKQQLEYIRLSIELGLPKNRHSRYFEKDCEGSGRIYSEMEEAGLRDTALKRIHDAIAGKAIREGADVGWMTLYFEGKDYWQLRPVDLSLYDGISGIAVYLAYMEHLGVFCEKELLECAMQKLFHHTECEEAGKEGAAGEGESEKTGLLMGEGSLAYAYLLLYQLTGEPRYGLYARRQARLLQKRYPLDREFDLLSGNAGAVVVLARLYEVFHEEEWLRLAEEIGEFLWKKAQKQETGYGWCGESAKRALAGMAHGNSGFIMAYAALLKHTHDKKYQEIIRELLKFEDSLYSLTVGNWRDLRNTRQEVYANAWCHGAVGILLSRLRLYGLEEYKENRRVLADIENAARYLFAHAERNGLCICHGMAGNYRSMTIYEKYFSLTEEQKASKQQVRQRLLEILAGGTKVLPQDKYKPGLMMGMAGIGCVIGGDMERKQGQKQGSR